MTRHLNKRGTRSRSVGRIVVGASVAAVLLVSAGVWWASSRSPSATDPAPAPAAEKSHRGTVKADPVVPARRAGSAVRPEAPISARLPSGIVVPIRPVSTGADGVLAVPHDIRTAGWWRGGSKLGDPFGSNLVAAHVDSVTQGLGPYVELLTIREGQRIVLTSAHLRQTFAVRSLKLVPQGTLRHNKSIYSASDPQRLTMVTCAPPYIKSKDGYQNLAIVTAVPITKPLPKAS